jgi:hypothetical protein
MFKIEGVDGAEPRMVARDGLIEIFASLAQRDLVMVDTALVTKLAVNYAGDHYISMEAGGLLDLLELHTRAVNALQTLMALRHPDELVEAHMVREHG